MFILLDQQGSLARLNVGVRSHNLYKRQNVDVEGVPVV